MAGMLQIITYMLGVYLVVKGVEVLQIALASSRPNRKPMIIIGALTLVGCVLAAVALVAMQDQQANAMASSMPSFPSMPSY